MRLSIYLAITSCLQVLAMWPAPQSLTTGSTVLWIEQSVKVTYNVGNVGPVPFPGVPYSQTEHVLHSQAFKAHGNGPFTCSSIVQPAISRALQSLFTQNIL